MYNLSTYGHLVGFFEELGIETEPSEMSFGLSIDDGRVEWGSHDLGSVFAQRKNAVSPSFLSMIYDVVRFGREAPEVGHALCAGLQQQAGCRWLLWPSGAAALNALLAIQAQFFAGVMWRPSRRPCASLAEAAYELASALHCTARLGDPALSSSIPPMLV